MGNGLSLSNYYENYERGFKSDRRVGQRQRQGHFINFEDVQTIIGSGSGSDWRKHKDHEHFLLISTLDAGRQDCIIKTTILAKDEEAQMNDIISGQIDYADNITVVVYGKNATDEKVMAKYTQLKTLGISNVCVYLGGMFEWLLLQDIYGSDLFPTTGKCLDILEFRSPSILS
jgi:hypothetical protein